MSAVTQEALREELESFAKEAIRRELSYFKNELLSDLIQDDLIRNLKWSLPATPAKKNRGAPEPERDKPLSEPRSVETAATYRAEFQHERSSYNLLSTYLELDDDINQHRRANIRKSRSQSQLVKSTLQMIVSSGWFKLFIMAIIFLNAVTFVAQADYMARHWTNHPPLAYFGLELTFFFVFAGEITLRMSVEGLSFCTNRAMAARNVFDLTLVILQACEIALMLQSQLSKDKFSGALRLFRCLRIFRVGRLLYLVPSLHMLVTSIVASFESLLWIMLLVILTTGIFAVILTEIVTDYKVELAPADFAPGQEILEDNYGTVDRTMLRLYQAMTDGIHWAELADPLMRYISPWACIILIIYSAFVNFALMNIVTAFFVETAMSEAQQDYQMLMSKVLWKSFHMLDMDNEHEITEEEFMSSLGNPAMLDYLAKLGVDEQKAWDMNFFKLLDKDNNGSLSGNELMAECIKLLGPARAVDLASLVRLVREEREVNKDNWRKINEVLELMYAKVQSGGNTKKVIERTTL